MPCGGLTTFDDTTQVWFVWLLLMKCHSAFVWIKFKSSALEVFFKKSALKNLAKFPKLTEKYLCQSVFFNKVAGLRPAILLKKDCDTQVFLWILRNFKNAFFYRTPLVAASKNSNYGGDSAPMVVAYMIAVMLFKKTYTKKKYYQKAEQMTYRS